MPLIDLDPAVFDDKAKSSSVSAAVDALIREHPVVIFSKSHCPYTPAVTDLLADQLQITVYVLEINLTQHASAIQKHLKKLSGKSTVPQAFVDDELLGEHDQVVAMDQKGELEGKVKQHMKGPRRAPTSPNTYPPLFFFPPTVDKWAIRATGLVTSTLSSGLAYSMMRSSSNNNKSIPYLGLASAALFGDYTLRLIAGSKASPLAKLGGALAKASKKEVIPRPGTPKQFASLCGCMFSGLGAALYAAGEPVLGGGFLGVLALCSGLEGAMDYCLGCEFFAIGDSIYQSVSDLWKRKMSSTKAC